MRSRLTALLMAISTYQAWDFYYLATRAPDAHVVADAVAWVVGGLAILWFVIRKRRRRVHHKRPVSEALPGAPKVRWQAMVERDEVAIQATRQLLQSMQMQFDRWKFTPPETEVAMLLIKGLTLEECAQSLAWHDVTVRTIAASVFAKAHLSNRHQFAAYILGDLMVEPIEPAPRSKAAECRHDAGM